MITFKRGEVDVNAYLGMSIAEAREATEGTKVRVEGVVAQITYALAEFDASMLLALYVHIQKKKRGTFRVFNKSFIPVDCIKQTSTRTGVFLSGMHCMLDGNRILIFSARHTNIYSVCLTK